MSINLVSEAWHHLQAMPSIPNIMPPRKGLQKSLTNFFSGFSHQLLRNLVNFLTIWSPSLQTPNRLATMFCHCCSEGSSRQGCQIMKCWRHFVWHLYYSATSSIYRSSAAIGFKRTLRNKRLYGKKVIRKTWTETAIRKAAIRKTWTRKKYVRKTDIRKTCTKK